MRLSLLVLACAASLAADPLGFSSGTEPVVIDTSNPDAWVSASACAACHPSEHAQWSRSRHRTSWTNNLMQAGFVAEPLPFCITCHAPSQPQIAEVMTNLEAYRQLGPHGKQSHHALQPILPEPHAAEGITCATCHLREGKILTATPEEKLPYWAPHDFISRPDAGGVTACASCHEFQIPVMVDGALRLTENLMQSTVTEWRAWQARTGSTKTCQDCHMPDCDHTMPGAHDRQRVRDALLVDVVGSPTTTITLTARGTGHAFPTGDLFRNLTLEVRPRRGADWTVLERFGRTFAVEHDDGIPTKRPATDTRLRPGEPRHVAIPAAFRRGDWRVVMHLGSTHDEQRQWVPEEELVYVIHNGSLIALP